MHALPSHASQGRGELIPPQPFPRDVTMPSPLRLLKTVTLVVVAVGLCLTRGWGQVYDPHTGDPPSHSHVQFTTNDWQVEATPDGGKLSGTCRLDCYVDEYDQVYLKLRGLKGQGLYTVWMVKRDKGESEERAGVSRHWNGDDASRFDFTAEPSGSGYYNGWTQKCPLGRWKFLEVRYHPNGNMKDLDSSVVALRVRLRPQ